MACCLRTATKKIALERRHSAAVGAAEREILGEVTVAVECMQLVILLLGQTVFEYCPKGFLAGILARIIGKVGVARSSAVILGSPACDGAWILRARRIQEMRDQGQFAIPADIMCQFANEVIAFHVAVLAVAVLLQASHNGRITPIIKLARRGSTGTQIAIAAAAELDFVDRAILRSQCTDFDHAASGIAIQRRKRSAQYFDPLDRARIDNIRLPLAIHQRLRNAIDQDAHAAYAKRRACTKAAYG